MLRFISVQRGKAVGKIIVTARTVRLERISCPLCGSNDPEKLFDAQDAQGTVAGSFTLVRCRKCHFEYLNPRPVKEDFYKCYADDYLPHSRQAGAPAGKDRFERYERKLSKLILANFYHYPMERNYASSPLVKVLLFPFYLRFKDSRKNFRLFPFIGEGYVLDVGCGSGAFAKFLQMCGFFVKGIDVSARAIENARRGGVDADCTTLEKARFPDKTFDVVNMWHVLEHCDDPIGTMKKVRRILKDEGLFVLSVPLIDGLGGRLFGPDWSYLELPRHLNQFTRATLSAALEKAGFRIKEVIEDRRGSDIRESLQYVDKNKHRWLRFLFASKFLRRPAERIIAWKRRSSAVVVRAVKG